jgi:hypothetical protein
MDALQTDSKTGEGAQPKSPAMPRKVRRLLDARERIMNEPADRTDFLHTVMCQVGKPRRMTEARTFERHNGHLSILLEAGKLYNGKDWIDQPLPYGTTPRLVMVHLSSEAIRMQSRRVEIGDSMRQFLLTLGMGDGGGPRGGYTAMRKQIEALAACRLSIGMHAAGKVVTVDAKPIKRFEAWLQPESDQPTLWPGFMELSPEFYDTLTNHAVPLDYRALAALKHSALALDIYTWLAHRLCRIAEANGVMLGWHNLREQFGQEYSDPKDFKREFRDVLRQVLVVYPTARIEEVEGGIRLQSSPPPICKTSVSFSLASSAPATGDNSGDTEGYSR